MKAPTTNLSLLERIREGDPVSWQEFYQRYQPFVCALGSCKGLHHDECQELMQLVMIQFFDVSKRFVYQPEIGRFHTYLGRIIRNRAIDLLRKRQTGQKYFAPLEAAEQSGHDEFDAEWDRAYREQLLQDALEELKTRVESTTWQAYELFGLQGKDAKLVAQHLGMKTENVYNCKKRCEKQMRKILLEMGYES